jgi:hypothetical protein
VRLVSTLGKRESVCVRYCVIVLDKYPLREWQLEGVRWCEVGGGSHFPSISSLHWSWCEVCDVCWEMYDEREGKHIRRDVHIMSELSCDNVTDEDEQIDGGCVWCVWLYYKHKWFHTTFVLFFPGASHSFSLFVASSLLCSQFTIQILLMFLCFHKICVNKNIYMCILQTDGCDDAECEEEEPLVAWMSS